MKYKVSITLFLVLSLNVSAQDWLTNFEDGKNLSAANNKNIILVFQGSDWCAPCIKLDKQVWSTEEFQKLSKDHFVMLKADFPRRKANKLSVEMQEQNNNLAELYNKQGYFPLVVILDSNGKIIGKMGYEDISPNAYFKKLTSFE